MIKVFSLLIISCLLSLSLCQFLPPQDTLSSDDFPFDDEDFNTHVPDFDDVFNIEYSGENNEENAWENEEYFYNNPEEIGDAVRTNLARVITAYSEVAEIIGTGISISVTPRLDDAFDIDDNAAANLGKRIGQVFSDVIKDMTNSAETVGKAIGNMVAEAVKSYRDARDKGEDSSAAIGVVIANAIRELDRNSEMVGDAIEITVREAINRANLNSADVDKAVNYISEGIQRFVSAISEHADVIGVVVGNAASNAANRGENAVEVMSYLVSNLALVIKENVSEFGESVGNMMEQAFEGYEAITENQLRKIRNSVRRDLRRAIRYDDDHSIEKFGNLLNISIISARSENGGIANLVDVVNEIGRRFVEDIEHTRLVTESEGQQ